MALQLPDELEIKHKDAFLFEGRFKDYEISITKEDRPDSYYIEVWDDDGHAYDGYWKDLKGEEMRGAILEALNGACLL